MEEEMWFNDGWMDLPLHTHALSAAIDIAADHCGGDPAHVANTSEFLFHFMSCWYQTIVDHQGALVQPAVKSIAWFVQHMIDRHDMSPMAAVPCASMLTRFTALVITKSGGKLV